MTIVANSTISPQTAKSSSPQRSRWQLAKTPPKFSKRLDGTTPTYLCRCLDDPRKHRLDERAKLSIGHRQLLKVLILAGAYGDSACWKSIASITASYDLSTRSPEDKAVTCKKKIKQMLKDLVLWQYIVMHYRTDRNGRDMSPLILILNASGIPFEWNRSKLLTKSILVKCPNKGKFDSKNQRRISRQKDQKVQKDEILPALRGANSPPNTYPLKGDMCVSNNSVLSDLQEIPRPDSVVVFSEKKLTTNAKTKTEWGWRLSKLGVTAENVAEIEKREEKTPIEKILKALDYIADKKYVSAGAYFTMALKNGWERATELPTQDSVEEKQKEQQQRRNIIKNQMQIIFEKYENNENISALFCDYGVTVKDFTTTKCAAIPLDADHRIEQFKNLCEKICK